MLGTITKVAVCLALIVVLFHDGIALGLAQVTADQDAEVAARAGAQNYQQFKDPQRAYDAAALAVADKGTEIPEDTFEVTSAGDVTLVATRSTSTMAANRFSWFDKLTHPQGVATVMVEPNS